MVEQPTSSDRHMAGFENKNQGVGKKTCQPFLFHFQTCFDQSPLGSLAHRYDPPSLSGTQSVIIKNDGLV
jgi:hypothetical protein